MMNHIGFGGPMFLNWGSGLGLLLLRLAPATIMTNYQYQLFGKFLVAPWLVIRSGKYQEYGYKMIQKIAPLPPTATKIRSIEQKKDSKGLSQLTDSEPPLLRQEAAL